jgi:hypothetical protein
MKIMNILLKIIKLIKVMKKHKSFGMLNIWHCTTKIIFSFLFLFIVTFIFKSTLLLFLFTILFITFPRRFLNQRCNLLWSLVVDFFPVFFLFSLLLLEVWLILSLFLLLSRFGLLFFNNLRGTFSHFIFLTFLLRWIFLLFGNFWIELLSFV